jgi:hypothetical protein
MKLYTFYSDSHQKILFDYFLKNFPISSFNNGIELVLKQFPQECESGSYMENGWNLTMQKKVDYIIKALDETKKDEWFVHSDCDILLFDGWENILESHKNSFDMLIQNDHPELCAGFFFCKSNQKTKSMWRWVKENMNNFNNDQSAMNSYLFNFKKVKVGLLPNTYFTYGYYNKGRWSGEQFEIPNINNLKTFHANWTSGVDNKINLLNTCLKQKNKI